MKKLTAKMCGPQDQIQHAEFLRTVNGQRFFRVPVRVRLNSSRACATLATLRFFVIAPSAAEAANWVRDNEPGVFARAETEIDAWGERGGRQSRFIGWESAVGAAMFHQQRMRQWGCGAQLELEV